MAFQCKRLFLFAVFVGAVCGIGFIPAGCSGSGASPGWQQAIVGDQAEAVVPDARRHHSPSPSPSPSPTPTATSTSSGSGMPAYLYGITDDEGGASVNSIAATIQSFGTRMNVRIVADGSGWDASSDAQRAAAYQPYAGVILQLYDSSDVSASRPSLATAESVTNQYLANSSSDNVFEVGNEINGTPGSGWLSGCPSDKSAFTASTPCVGDYYNMWKLVHAAGKQTALTFYYEPQPGNGYDMVGYASHFAAAFPDMASALNYVLVSYYEVDNGNVRLTQAQWTSLFSSLHVDFPNAKLGFGEIGLDNPVSSGTLSRAESIMSYYYGLRPSVPGWVGGDFWWYGAEDIVPSSKPLFSLLKSLI